MVLWLLLTSAASAWLLNQGYCSQPGGRSPQVRTLAFPAHLPDLLLWHLVALGFAVNCQLARPCSLIRFVFLRSQVCFRLPPDPASQRRPCLPLAVGATNLRTGLSPASQRPCWAHNDTLTGLKALSMCHFHIFLLLLFFMKVDRALGGRRFPNAHSAQRAGRCGRPTRIRPYQSTSTARGLCRR